MLLHSSRCREEDVPAPVHLAAQRWGGGFKVGGLPDVRPYPESDSYSYELWFGGLLSTVVLPTSTDYEL